VGNRNLILAPSAQRSASGNSAALETSQMTELAVFLVVSEVSGTSPSLTAVVQDSPDGDNWADAYSFPAVSSAPSVLRAGWQDLKMSIGRYARLTWTITGGSASFTFSAHVVPVSSD